MPASKKKQAEVELKRQRAWEMHINGATQWDISAAIGVTQSRVCELIKQAARQHPTVSLSYEERAALAEAKWNQSEALMLEQIADQQANGRQVVETTTFSDGSVQRKVIAQAGVDPALLRALSTHTDRRNRQAQNQISPDAGVSQVNVNVVKDFLNQGETKGSLSASSWNESQGAIDV